MDEDVDHLLAEQLHKLSHQDRNKIQEEIHGVHSMAPEETPEMVLDALHRLDQEIMQVSDDNKQAFLQAQANNPNAFVLQSDYRLKFLRASLFDPQKAAVRYTQHLYLLLKYFGAFSLERPLQYSDLNKEEQEIFRKGQNQILPSRDRSGRLICCHYHSIGGPNVNPSVRVSVSSMMVRSIQEIGYCTETELSFSLLHA